jgi:diguanylate cyclase (GGDEF)-like protein
MPKRVKKSESAPTGEHERTCSVIPHVTTSSEKHAFLLVLSGPHFGEIIPVPAGKPIVIGRREDADFQILDDGISRRHASILLDGEGATIRDLGSANGTYVDGTRVSEARIVDGARIHVGGLTTLKFAWADELEAHYQMKLAEAAQQDSLTGLYNRRHFEERLLSELAAAQRHDRPACLLMVDVDHFKEVNDEHGHLAGDEVLKMVAFVLRGAVRKEDVLARFGGEEFVVIARETAFDGARALGERIRRAVERSRCTFQGKDLGVTVSIGVTVSVGLTDFVAGKSEREMIAAADRALYLAKEGGRNRVVALPIAEDRRAS